MSLSAFLGMSHCSPGGAGGSGQGETGLASLFRLLPHDQTLDEQKKIDGQMTDGWTKLVALRPLLVPVLSQSFSRYFWSCWRA